MTSRFPGPWRIAEFPNGFAVYDATGRQLGFFYGRADSNMAGQAGFLMIDDARQIAVDFARLPELLNQISDQSVVATSTEDDKLAKLETNRSPQGAPETSHLPHAAQLSVITVTASPSVKAPTTIRRSISFEPDGRRSPQMLRRRRDSVSIRTKFLIGIAVVALVAGYFVFGDSDPPVHVASAPRAAPAGVPPVEFLPLPERQAPDAAAVGADTESRIDPEVRTASRPLPPDIEPIENGIARPPQALPPKEKQSFTPSQEASICFPSPSAVRQNYPEGWPSWTFKAPGHEGTKCWYPKKRTTTAEAR